MANGLKDVQDRSEKELVSSILLNIKTMLREAKIKLPPNTEAEISHHFGLEHVSEFGAGLITVVNREYCKKLVIQLPRQKHPYHYHKTKSETFQVLFGDLSLEVDGHPHKLLEGEIFTVDPGMWHKFDTLEGVIFEEISTKSIIGDSYYEDEKITNNSARKTHVKLF